MSVSKLLYNFHFEVNSLNEEDGVHPSSPCQNSVNFHVSCLDEHFEVRPFSSGIKHGMGLNILSGSIMDLNHFNTENILISTGRH